MSTSVDVNTVSFVLDCKTIAKVRSNITLTATKFTFDVVLVIRRKALAVAMAIYTKGKILWGLINKRK